MKLRDLNPGDRYILSGLNKEKDIIEIYRGVVVEQCDGFTAVLPDGETKAYPEDSTWDVEIITDADP